MAQYKPVILGTDANAYGMARAFHEEYGILSDVIGRGALPATDHSDILNRYLFSDLYDRFVEVLITHAQRDDDAKILIASADGYAELVIRHREELSKYYLLPFATQDLFDQMSHKKSFYQMCEQYGLPYPDTIYIEQTDDMKRLIDDCIEKWGTHLVIKPSNSMSYFELSFEGKEKVYLVNTRDSALESIQKMRAGGYEETIVVQRFIEGDDQSMKVLNTISDANGKVRFMCLGQTLLEDPTPELRGNYLAILGDYDEDILTMVQQFLEQIAYTGIANFDLKYDPIKKQYVVFEINMRQGRSSFYTTVCGYNFAKYLVASFSLDHEDVVKARPKGLWLGCDLHVLTHCVKASEYKQQAMEYVAQGAYGMNFLYEKDRHWLRDWKTRRYYRSYRTILRRHYAGTK